MRLVCAIHYLTPEWADVHIAALPRPSVADGKLCLSYGVSHVSENASNRQPPFLPCDDSSRRLAEIRDSRADGSGARCTPIEGKSSSATLDCFCDCRDPRPPTWPGLTSACTATVETEGSGQTGVEWSLNAGCNPHVAAGVSGVLHTNSQVALPIAV